MIEILNTRNIRDAAVTALQGVAIQRSGAGRDDSDGRTLRTR